MLRTFEGNAPRIDPTAFVSEAAYVVGDVRMGPDSSVWPGAVLRADFSPITVGANTHIEDNVTVHQGPPGVEIGDNVTIGHNAVIHCRRIGDTILIGNHATILDGAEIGANCVVAAGAVVRPGTVVPDNSFVVGVPATVRPLSPEMQANTTSWNAGYADLARRYKAAGLGDDEVRASDDAVR
jgi:carbonic anhydrase/acetyltransferase-like protein (isoleucine patch superfamily)